ncbi:MAG: T9SS type A sorting domain-containing protein [Ignavibacteria bacterium]
MANVSLKVYNALGAEVAVLVNENKPAGSILCNLTVQDYPSGIYYYKLEAEGFQ